MANASALIQELSHSDVRPEDAASKSHSYRTYDKAKIDDCPISKRVHQTYSLMHTNQSFEYVQERTREWCKFNKFKATIMEALEILNEVVDESDPDFDMPNSYHAFLTAESIRKSYPDLDWFHLTGLIHDLGKVMAKYGEPQWSTVGDTFAIGCEYSDKIVYGKESFKNNPDFNNKKFNTKYGMYSPNCGLENVIMSWGHDEYMYKVLRNHGSTLPDEAMYIIRFHSFFPWHHENEYTHLCNNKDEEMLPWIKEFSKFDLYTKTNDALDIEALKPYYQGLINKYCPGKISF